MRVARSFCYITLMASVGACFFVLMTNLLPIADFGSLVVTLEPARVTVTPRSHLTQLGSIQPTEFAHNHRNATRPTATTQTNVEHRTKVLILTTRRSGSSFVGQLLNQHPGFYYVFEPLRLHGSVNASHVAVETNVRLLSRLFGCKLWLAVREAAKHYGQSQPPLPLLLGSTFERHLNGEKQGRMTTSLRDAGFTCAHRRNHVAVKVIRIYQRQLPVVRALVRLEGVHIVHLIRDPRGVISSRAKIDQIRTGLSDAQYFGDQSDAMLDAGAFHCQRVVLTLNAMQHAVETQPGFKEHYQAVRYEDFAYEPAEMTTRLYQRLRIPLHSHVIKWLNQATQQDVPSPRNGKLGYSYSTNRNSSNTAEAWRLHLPFVVVDAIQRIPHCDMLMRRLGYTRVNTEAELLNSSVSLVSTIPI